MKKSLKVAAAAVALSTPAMAANLENPLYMPTRGEVYSKTGIGLMYKVADSSFAHDKKNHDGKTEFPIWRVSEELGIGITDKFAIRGVFQYTHDGDIDRKGMNNGRLGAIYRAIDTLDGFKFDVYANAVLGGISDMTGAYTPLGFDYDNYSTGRWAVDAGIRFGKTWSKLTTSAFVEVIHSFGSNNNKIDVTTATFQDGVPLTLTQIGFPDEISVNLKDTTEVNFGLNAFYEINHRWSVGALFKYTNHANNGVESLESQVIPKTLPDAQVYAIVDGLESQLENMKDGFDEYMVGLSLANQITDSTQVVLYGEYTFDDANRNSQNGTDIKTEMGVRVNVAF